MRSPRTPGTSLGENSVQRNYTRLCTTWKSKIWSEEIQNTHYSSHNESLNLKDDNYWKPINWQIKLNVRQYICVANWRWRTVFIKNATQEVAKNLKNWKEAAIKRKYWKTTKIGRIFCAAWSGITYGESIERNQVRRLQELLVYIEDSKIFHDPDWLSSYDGLAFLIKLSLPRVQESLAAILECCEIHGKIWVFQETFLVVNMLDEILMNCAMIREIWRRCWVFWEQKELRKVKAENHCSQHLYLALPPFRQKVWTVESVLCSWLTVPWVLGLVFKAWQFRVISPRRCICKNSRTKQNFRAGSWISEWKFAQRLAINGNGAKFLHRAEDLRMFSAEDNWILFKCRHLQFSTHACHGTPRERSGRRKEISPGASILFSTESEGTDWREKLKQSKGQSCDLR